MMNSIPNYIVPIALDCIGEKTRSRWTGTFYVKCAITHADRFAIERLYNALLPTSLQRQAEDELVLRAETIAQLHVRIVEGPDWWNTTKSGQLLIDSEPLYELLRLTREATEKWTLDLESKVSGVTNAVSENA